MNEQDFDYLDKLKIQLWVNDELRQNDSTRQMIFKPADTINEISSFMNLSAGDLILTGTPGGVIVKAPSKLKQGIATWLLTNEKKIQIFRKQKDRFLQDGDVIKTHISSEDGHIDLGYQRNTVISM